MTSHDPYSDEDAADGRALRLMLGGLVAALVVALLVLVFAPREVDAQGVTRTSAFVVTAGTDTIVVERVTPTRTGFDADLAMKGQARMLISADVAGTFVPTLRFRVWGAGASTDSKPMQSGTQTMTADSAFIGVVVGDAPERKLSRAIANKPLPLLNNEFMTFELAVQRALAQGGGTQTVPMFALSGGVQIDMTMTFGGDSVICLIANQEQTYRIDKTGRLLSGRIKGQPVVITRVEGADAMKISLGRPDYGAPAGAPYTAEEVSVKTPMGHVLSGTLTMPAGAKGKVPAVVTITGSGQQDRDELIPVAGGYRLFRQIADTLGRRGIAVLRLDDRGINGSGGEVVKATSADFADDIRAGVAYLRGRAEIDGGRIALVGHSEGGMIAPMVAATDAKLAGIVLMAGPAYTGKRIIDFQLKNGVEGAASIPAAKKDSAMKAVRAEFDSTSGKVAWMQYFLTYDPVPTARKVKVPVFIMQGATDQQVTPDQAPVLEQAFKAAGNKDVTMTIFKDRNHLFLNDPDGFPGNYGKLKSARVDGEVMGAFAEWMVKHLKP